MRTKTARGIRRFIESELLDGPWEHADPLTAQLLDSLAIEELIAYIEATYEIRFDEQDVIPAHFGSVAALAAFVDGKRRGR